MDSHAHLIEVDETGRSLAIYRVRGAERQLFTSVKLPEATQGTDRPAIENFCRMLGENILLDSPSARRLLGL
ncbi:MAG: hypothetical protein ACREP9_10870 [Candidatus Dormibacteraceae bacterium]